MASAVPVLPFHLAVGVAYLLVLASAAAKTTELLHASVLPHGDTTLTLAGRPAYSSSTSASTTQPDDDAPRRLDVSAPAVACEDSTALATTATAAPSPPACSSCPCVRVVVHVREAAVENLVPAPGSIAAAATRRELVLHALPLLAVPFLPTPLAALIALSALVTPVRAGHLSTNATCSVRDRDYATCTVYRYLPNGCADRTKPFAGLRKVCHGGRGSDERALSGPCSCGQRQGTFHSYCRVRTLELDQGPETFRLLPGHQTPIYDLDAVVATGEEVCYVELEGRDYREGYYIRCPVRKCASLSFLCCPESPHDAAVVAAA